MENREYQDLKSSIGGGSRGGLDLSRGGEKERFNIGEDVGGKFCFKCLSGGISSGGIYFDYT